MGKLDDMRAAREALHGVVAAAPDADADSGRCSVCGKKKAVEQGLVVSHQKGLGKMCAGSRKAPAG